MKTSVFRRIGSYIGVVSLFMVLLIVPQMRANAAGETISIKAEESSVTVGQTLHVDVSITNNGPNAIQPFSILCSAPNGVLTYQQPNFFFVVNPGETHVQTVSFLAARTGTESIKCQVGATDVVTDAGVTGTSNTLVETVGTSSTLGFTAYGSASNLRVGETVVVTLKYVNHGTTPITHISLGCDVLASPAIVLVSSPAPLQTLPGGWSQFVQWTYKASEVGTSILDCHVTANDSAGNPISLHAPRFTITVR